jgi:3,4-dihydroxy 2-butanone 4-phosphate synthase / GTP cyclohydrolase II
MPTAALARKSIQLVERALRDIRAGKLVVLTDDEDRENEGDLVMAAEKVTPQAINFMARHGRGLICLSLTEERIKQLQLPLMVSDNTSPYQTAFTVSIEAARGVTTGISAADRAHTILTAVAPRAKPGDLARPGHVFPLRARDGGVLVRTGQTEGSVDLARLAGLYPAGVICEVMNEDGSMSRRPELLRFSRKHRLTLLSVADLITWRLARERLVRRVATRRLSKEPFGEFEVHAYASDVDSTVHLALVKGDLSGPAPTLVRVHRATALGDLLGHAAGDGPLRQSFAAIAQEGRGVIVWLQKHPTAAEALELSPPPKVAHKNGASGGEPLRELGLGAQILKDLGLSRIRLLTTRPRHIVGLERYGLEVTEQVQIAAQVAQGATGLKRPAKNSRAQAR